LSQFERRSAHMLLNQSLVYATIEDLPKAA
jgi:hypothetical protein